jgi:prepilin-type N-terminal cleavage/methylation domain-containing protein
MTRGFTLIEVVVAVALVGFVGLAAAALLESAARSVRETESRERLLWVAGTVLDSLRREEGWSGGERTVAGGHHVRWSNEGPGGVLEVWPEEHARPWLVLPVGGEGVVTAAVR